MYNAVINGEKSIFTHFSELSISNVKLLRIE